MNLGNGITRTRHKFAAADMRAQRGKRIPDASEKGRIRQYAERKMREGTTVASDSLDIIAFRIPDVAAIYLVQDKKLKLSDVEVDVTRNGPDFRMSFMSASADLTESSLDGAEAGFDAGSGSSLAKRGGSGRSIYWTPEYPFTGREHFVDDHWEKWQSTASGEARQWAYNRYALFDAANGTFPARGEMVDATIRSRPFKGYTGRVTGGPAEYAPHPTETCTSYTANIGVGSYASLSVPFVNCSSEYEIYPHSGEHSMGTAWYGRSTAQRYLDFTFDLVASSTTTTPIYSDYVWMSVDWCFSLNCTFGPQQDVIWTDGGW